MTEQEYTTIEEAFKKAEEDTTPFVVISGNKEDVVVAGDANKTEINKHDFEMKFRVPQEKNGIVSYKIITKEFKGVYITPRQDTKIVKMLVKLIPYFKKIEKTGDVTELSAEEKRAIFESLDDEVYDAMYDVTASVLGIDKQLRDYMMPGQVLKAVAQIIEQYPEVINEADTFFV